jgi:hypothetical protein
MTNKNPSAAIPRLLYGRFPELDDVRDLTETHKK